MTYLPLILLGLAYFVLRCYEENKTLNTLSANDRETPHDARESPFPHREVY